MGRRGRPRRGPVGGLMGALLAWAAWTSWSAYAERALDDERISDEHVTFAIEHAVDALARIGIEGDDLEALVEAGRQRAAIPHGI